MKRRLFADLLAAETAWLESLSEPGERQQLPRKAEWRRQDVSELLYGLCKFQTNIDKLNHRQTSFPVALPYIYIYTSHDVRGFQLMLSQSTVDKDFWDPRSLDSQRCLRFQPNWVSSGVSSGRFLTKFMKSQGWHLADGVLVSGKETTKLSALEAFRYSTSPSLAKEWEVKLKHKSCTVLHKYLGISTRLLAANAATY